MRFGCWCANFVQIASPCFITVDKVVIYVQNLLIQRKFPRKTQK
ncbi:hypothetical protein HMPREF9061_00806 [Actinomyces sp. oral taxon 181 str. F0379]|nr:hypothetical protein HMPREF9061_00806 [Actinomyces sp. oral taxon 181 str. F0379]